MDEAEDACAREAEREKDGEKKKDGERKRGREGGRAKYMGIGWGEIMGRESEEKMKELRDREGGREKGDERG